MSIQDARKERFCCDGRCNDNQGRGICPAINQPLGPEDKRSLALWSALFLPAGIALWGGLLWWVLA